MQGDFSRITFDPAKHFSAVLSQQGRVTLDADLNEGFLAVLHYIRAVVTDIVGPCAYPATAEGGFKIGLLESKTGDPDLTISGGRMYVDGILVENESDGWTYWNQPDRYLDHESDEDKLPAKPYLVYLRVWERLITAALDPAIREIALGDLAPDTSARRKVTWQLAAAAADLPTSPPPNSEVALQWIEEHLRRRDAVVPRLRARAVRPNNSDDTLCDLAPDASYRGAENQLYRVEVHTGGAAQPSATATQVSRTGAKWVAAGSISATFKFSRENASVVFPISSIAGDDVTLSALGRYQKLGLEVGDWVEIVDNAYDLRAADEVQPVPTAALRRVRAIDPADRLVTLEDDTSGGASGPYVPGTNPDQHPLLRRWDHSSSTRTDQIPVLDVAADGALPIIEDGWIDIEDGIQVLFGSASGGDTRQYRRGDYWWIPARTIPGDVLWPQDGQGPAERIPDGVEYHYAPLAWVDTTGALDLRDPIATPHGDVDITPFGESDSVTSKPAARRRTVK
jgi:hypothetical protein